MGRQRGCAAAADWVASRALPTRACVGVSEELVFRRALGRTEPHPESAWSSSPVAERAMSSGRPRTTGSACRQAKAANTRTDTGTTTPRAEQCVQGDGQLLWLARSPTSGSGGRCCQPAVLLPIALLCFPLAARSARALRQRVAPAPVGCGSHARRPFPWSPRREAESLRRTCSPS